jgi:Flp pilus assembly protein TadD
MQRTRLLGAAAIFAAGTFGMQPVNAQSAGETTVAPQAADPVDPFIALDQLADSATEEDRGLVLAQEQAGRGEFLEALATIERILALHPKSQSARLLHAVFLCRIDDLPGGAVEIDTLKKKNFSKDLWAQAQAACKIGKGGVQ